MVADPHRPLLSPVGGLGLPHGGHPAVSLHLPLLLGR